MKRIAYIDFAKGIAIFLMVLCHCGLHNKFTQWVYAFHMPLFFIVSGYFLHKSTVSFPIIKSLFEKLFIPYIVWALILCFGNESYLDWVRILYGSRNALYEAQSFTPLWFLPCFFVSTILARLLKYFVRQHFVIRFFTALILGLIGFVMARHNTIYKYGFPLNLDVALVGTFLIIIGDWFYSAKLSNKLILVLGGVIGSILCYWNLPMSLTPNNPHVEMSIGQFGNEILFLLCSTSITFGLIYFSNLICQCRYLSNLNKCVCWVGKNSLPIMCLHGIFISLYLKAISYLIFSPNTMIYIDIIIAVFAIISVRPLIYMIKKYIPQII